MKRLKTLTTTLPIEIFYNHIFLYLPVKSLTRFHGVCREWNDVINEPYFVRKHLHHSKQRRNSLKLMIYSYPLHVYFSLDHQTIRSGDNDDIQAVKLQYPINPVNDYNIPLPVLSTIAGSVNGLVCIPFITYSDDLSTILVWNPTTRVHKVLPPHPDFPVTGKHGIGFGYNSTTNDYNVVRVVSVSRIDIYSLKTNSWKLVMRGKDIPSHSPTFRHRFGVCCIDGLIYWIAYHMRTDGIIPKSQFIACFDLKEVDDDEKKKKNKVIREIQMPGDFGMLYVFAELKVIGGCLSLFKEGWGFGTLEMWSMLKINGNKNDQVEYRWINRVILIRDAFFSAADILNARFILPICFSHDGKIVLRVPGNTPSEFVLYDTDTTCIQNLHPIQWIDKMGICMWGKVPIQECQMCIESLVSPNFMSVY